MNGKIILALHNHEWTKTSLSTKLRSEKASQFIEKWELEYSSDTNSGSQPIDTSPEVVPPTKKIKLLDDIDETIQTCRKGNWSH